MNIEEERKAFDLTLESKEKSATSFLLNEYRYAAVKHDIKEALFESWLASKAHAEEMAKPVARYFTINGLVNLFDGNSVKGIFESVADAKVWAQVNGYRVVDE